MPTYTDRLADRLDKLIKLLPGLLVLSIFVWLLSLCSGPHKIRPVDCRADLACWAQRHSAAAQLACPQPIERMLMYPHRWSDSGGPGLITWQWADQAAGTLTYGGANLSVQGPGAGWTSRPYSCTYDPTAQRVLTVSVEAG